jgi:ATP-dependent DNA helicase RecG
MIIHRDYTSSSDSIVKVFNDHILFFNPGGLPDSISIEQLLTNNYVSTPRNRQIAKIVKEMGWIEKYGTGIKRVRNMFVEYGLKQPLFELIPGGFGATVFAKNNNVVDNVVDNVVGKRLKRILSLLEENNKLSAKELSLNFGVSSRTIQRDIEKLKEAKKLERVGSEKDGHWKIIE